MSIIPEVKAVKQLKQYYKMIEDAKASMPKGAPNKSTAMRFLAEVSKPEYQANLPFHIRAN